MALQNQEKNGLGAGKAIDGDNKNKTSPWAVVNVPKNYYQKELMVRERRVRHKDGVVNKRMYYNLEPYQTTTTINATTTQGQTMANTVLHERVDESFKKEMDTALCHMMEDERTMVPVCVVNKSVKRRKNPILAAYNLYREHVNVFGETVANSWGKTSNLDKTTEMSAAMKKTAKASGKPMPIYDPDNEFYEIRDTKDDDQPFWI